MDSNDDKVLTDYGVKPDGSPFSKHPGEQHQFRTVCIECGEHGQLFIAVFGPDERPRIEPIDADK
jgi:hypothetical protein